MTVSCANDLCENGAIGIRFLSHMLITGVHILI